MVQHRPLSAAPLLLAIESATGRASVALLRGETLIGALEAESGQHHAERLLPMIDTLLNEQGFALDDLEAFAISIGPGAFTSLRIGLSTLKGLAFGSDAPVAPVSTLEGLAWAARGASPRGPIAATLDARRGEVYAGAWAEPGAGEAALLDESVYMPDELLDRLPAGSRIVGEGVALFEPEQRDRAATAGIEIELEAAVTRPSAAALGQLGLALLARGGGCTAEELVPRYVRRAEAEVQRTAQRFE